MKKERVEAAHSKNSEAILATTRELIKEKGYMEVSVRDICDRAGVSRSSFYSIFAGKDEVLVHMIRMLKEDTDVVLNEFILAENDLEKIWRLFDIYLNVALEFGPDIMGSLYYLDLQDSIGFIEQFYLYNEWFNLLVKNCQQKGIVRNTGSSTELVNAGVYAAFGTVYEWCRKKGGFDLREECFKAHEAIYDIHPDYRGLWKKMK